MMILTKYCCVTFKINAGNIQLKVRPGSQKTTNMESFATILNGWKPLTIAAKALTFQVEILIF